MVVIVKGCYVKVGGEREGKLGKRKQVVLYIFGGEDIINLCKIYVYIYIYIYIYLS